MSIKMVLVAIAVFTMGTQAMTQEMPKQRLLVGSELAFSIGTYTDLATGEKYREGAYRLGPQLGWYVTPRLVAGLSAEHEWHRSNYLEELTPPLYGAGLFARYYFIIRALDKPLGKDRIRSYAGASYHRINYYQNRSGELEVNSKLDGQLVFLNAGLNIRIFQRLYLELSAKPVFYINRRTLFTGRTGFEYHFRTKPNKP